MPGKQKITKEKYDAIVAAFRKHGDNFKAVATECGVHWHTAKKAWEEGWAAQKDKDWALPIKDVLKQEYVMARAALEREKRDLVADHRIARQDKLREAIEAGFADIVESRAKQGKVIRAARDNSFVALVISQKLLKASIPLSDKIIQELSDDKSGLDVGARMRLLRQIGRFAYDAIEMSQLVEEMERKALGEPDTILEVQGGITMSVEEAKATLHEVAEVLGAYREGDIEDVIDVEYSDSSSDELAVPTGKYMGDGEPDTADDDPGEELE